MAKIKYTGLLSLLLLSSSALASSFLTADALKNVEISVAAGPTWTYLNNTHITISPYEDDAVKISSVSNSALWKIGVGYHLFTEQLRERDYFDDLLVELNLYRNKVTADGYIWQYQLPQFNNYNFSAPITSTRFMLDIKPSLFTLKHISLYPILGVGINWSTIAYHETVTGAGVDPNSYISLSSLTNTNFTYNLGLGVRAAFTTHLSASLEYFYTDLASMYPAGTSPSNATFVSQPVFKARSQSVLLGLNWTI